MTVGLAGAVARKCYHLDDGFVTFPRSALGKGVPSGSNCTANDVAHALLASAGQSRQLVALLVERGAMNVAAASLGVLKAGKASSHWILNGRWPEWPGF